LECLGYMLGLRAEWPGVPISLGLHIGGCKASSPVPSHIPAGLQKSGYCFVNKPLVHKALAS